MADTVRPGKTNERVIVQLDLPGSFQYLSILGVCIQEILSQAQISDEQTAYNIRLAAQEMCTNIVRHAYAGPDGTGFAAGVGSGRIAVILTVDTEPPRLILETVDQGSQIFDPAQVPEPGEMSVGGLGLALMRQLMDEIIYRPYTGQAWRNINHDAWHVIHDTEGLPRRAGNYWRMVKRL
jgi:serine/threonine-protein kinase RsbW